MKSIILSIFYKTFDLFFKENKVFYSICKHCVDRYEGENNSDIHNNGELHFLNNNAKHFEIVFDVGANRGEWTNLLLNINKDVEVHCFEPSPFTFKKLIANNFPKNVICNNIGLSSKKTEATLFTFQDGSECNSLYRISGLGKMVQRKEEKVKLDTLEDYCQKRKIDKIDFLKIDTEGHELEALKGAEQFIKKNKIGIIQFEYGGCDISSRTFLEDIIDFLKDLDYRIYKIFPKGVKFIKEYNQDFEDFHYANYLAIKNNLPRREIEN